MTNEAECFKAYASLHVLALQKIADFHYVPLMGYEVVNLTHILYFARTGRVTGNEGLSRSS